MEALGVVLLFVGVSFFGGGFAYERLDGAGSTFIQLRRLGLCSAALGFFVLCVSQLVG